MSRKRGHRYGAAHKAARRHFLLRMGRGEAFLCWRPDCPTPKEPVNPRSWDLGHVDPELRQEFGYRWPEHPSCNRRTMTHLKERLKAAENAPAEFSQKAEPDAKRATPEAGKNSREW